MESFYSLADVPEGETIAKCQYNVRNYLSRYVSQYICIVKGYRLSIERIRKWYFLWCIIISYRIKG